MNRLTPDRADAILQAMEHACVLVVGDLMLDRYITGTVDRISPEAPVPVVRVKEESSALGGAANVAANVVALGAGCRVVGCVGADESGERILDRLEAVGVGMEGVVRIPGRPTTVKTRVLARRQQVVRVDHEDDGDIGAEVAAQVSDAVRAGLGRCSAVAVEDYNKGVLVPEVIRTVLDGGRRAGVPTVVDPKRFRFFSYGGATIFKPNEIELVEALSHPLIIDDPAWMEEARAKLGCETLVVTLGERGMVLRGADLHLRIPTVARSVYDVSGAGDTVTAAMAAAMAAGAEAVEAAILANHAAAVAVGKAGVDVVAPEEIREQIRSVFPH